MFSGPDRVFLVQIENRPGPEKIRPGPEKIRSGPEKSDLAQRKSDLAQRNVFWPRENTIWARCKIRLGQTIWCIMDQTFGGPEPGLARELDQSPYPGDCLCRRPDGLLDLIPQKYKRGALFITKRHHSASGQ